MHGNVWEWCQDWYAADDGHRVDPIGATQGSHRVLRGGSFFYPPRNVRFANRYDDLPGNRFANLGFRLARTCVLSP